jgi:hypothetical protein
MIGFEKCRGSLLQFEIVRRERAERGHFVTPQDDVAGAATREQARPEASRRYALECGVEARWLARQYGMQAPCRYLLSRGQGGRGWLPAGHSLRTLPQPSTTQAPEAEA